MAINFGKFIGDIKSRAGAAKKSYANKVNSAVAYTMKDSRDARKMEKSRKSQVEVLRKKRAKQAHVKKYGAQSYNKSQTPGGLRNKDNSNYNKILAEMSKKYK